MKGVVIGKCGSVGVLAVLLGVLSPAWSDDWPTYLHDAARSGVTPERLALPLQEDWGYEARHAPRPAWPAPAKQDFWHELRELSPVVVYDRAYHAVIAGGALFFASSADDAVRCLDAATGALRWVFFADGPVRLTPAVAGGNVYFGSDDGWVYCVRAADGALLWKHTPRPENRSIPGNGRVISSVPVRSSVVVDAGAIYYFAGLFPPQEVYACVLDADTGEERLVKEQKDVSPQGYLVASPKRLFVPTGRTNPAVFERDGLVYAGQLEGNGGAFAVLAEDALASGPGRRTGQELQFSDPASNEQIATCDGIEMVVAGPMAYIQSKTELMALNRPEFLARGRERNVQEAKRKDLEDRLKNTQAGGDQAEAQRLEAEMHAVEAEMARLSAAMNAAYVWRQPAQYPYALILAGDVLFVGGDGAVGAFRTQNGEALWSAKVPGRVYGLSVANGRLYASTDKGAVHCFSATGAPPRGPVAETQAPEPYPDDALSRRNAAAADHIIKTTGITKGYCVVLGFGEGRLACELARKTDLNIVGLEADEAKVAAARDALSKAGLYGTRITVRQWGQPHLPYTTYMANLIVSDSGDLSVPSDEVARVLRPYGGMACIGRPEDGAPALSEEYLEKWLKGCETSAEISTENGLWCVMRRAEPGDAEWTQLYANPGRTASSSEALRDPVAVQWFGEPGPRDIIDRHHRPMSSLFKDGRVFVPGDDLVITLDAYNGAPLWRLEIPDSRRVGALKNAGQMLVTDDYLYVARKDECWAVDVASGAHAFTLKAPQRGGARHDWGDLNCVGPLLFGTGQQEGASFNVLSKDTVNLLEGDHRPVVISRYLFCMDRHTGEERWGYENGAILNDAIAIDEGRIYFAESRREEIVDDEDGRTRLKLFCKSDTYLVALNIEDGKKAWEQPVTFPFQHIMYLNGAAGTILVSGSYNDEDKVFYGLFAFDMKTGEAMWDTSFRARDVRCTGYAEQEGSHGEQWQHPVLIDGTIYARPYAYDLRTGEKRNYMAYRGGHGCGGLTGSRHYLYGRGSNPRMYPIDVKRTDGIPLTLVSRPGCWLNIIPAGGLILIPESSSGCTCAYPLQTSFAFVPSSVLRRGV